jgi:uncharacterized protein (TIGR00251 family)
LECKRPACKGDRGGDEQAGTLALQSFTISDLPFNICRRVAWYREDSTGVIFSVHVVPRASRSEVAGLHDGALRIRVAAPPVDGAANRELVKFLAKKLRVARAAVELVSGSNSRNKIIRIENPGAATRS